MNDINAPQPKESTMKTASGINIILGIWLIISTWIIGYQSGGHAWSNVIVGAAVLILAWIRTSVQSRASVPSWINVLLGIWVIISPWAFQGVLNGQKWNCVIVGALVVIFALVSGSAGASRRTT